MKITIEFDDNLDSEQQQTSEYEIRRQAAQCINFVDCYLAIREMFECINKLIKNIDRSGLPDKPIIDILENLRDNFNDVITKYNLEIDN